MLQQSELTPKESLRTCPDSWVHYRPDKGDKDMRQAT